MVFVAITFGVLIFSYQKLRQLHVRISESQIEVPKILKIGQNDQNQRKFLFYFSSLRGRGKSSAMISEVKLTHFLILFFFRNLKMRLRHASCRNFRKKIISPYTNRNKPYQKIDHFSKLRSENFD